jgi:hypothetical protein
MPTSRNITAHVLRRLIESPDRPHTKLGRRKQIITDLSGGIEPGDGLIQVRADAAHQPGRRHEFHEGLPQRRGDRGRCFLGHRQRRFCGDEQGRTVWFELPWKRPEST